MGEDRKWWNGRLKKFNEGRNVWYFEGKIGDGRWDGRGRKSR